MRGVLFAWWRLGIQKPCNMEVSTSNHEFCKKDGVLSVWRLRSPEAEETDFFHAVGPDGGWGERGLTSGVKAGVSLGFCI